MTDAAVKDAWARKKWSLAFSRKRQAERAVIEAAVEWRKMKAHEKLQLVEAAFARLEDALDRLIALG